MNMYSERLMAEFQRRGILTAQEAARVLHVSQPTVSRVLSRLGSQRVVRIGGGRSTRYGLRRDLKGLGTTWPLYRVAQDAEVTLAGQLVALVAGRWYVQQAAPWDTLRGVAFPDGVYPGLPWFLQDVRPRGFLGRCFARRYAAPLGVAPDPRRWSDDDVAAALLTFGEELPGDLVVGDGALGAVQARRLEPCDGIAEADRPTVYPARAEAALAGEWPGSSAAGEQPKFTACVRAADGSIRHVIVKFSGRGERPENQRWADLLVAEDVANATLLGAGIPCAATRTLAADGRCFLESTRFDRVGAYGRRGLVSLEALDAAFFGAPDTSWTQAAERLRADRWIADGDADRLSVLWWFGTLIGNTDMHYGNVSLFLEETRPLTLAPTYDMVPMSYRPDVEGRLSNEPLTVVPPPPQARAQWVQAAMLAERFWLCLAGTDSVSPEFRQLSAQNARVVADRQAR